MRKTIKSLWLKLTWAFNPDTIKEAYRARIKNFFLHWFPPKVTKRSFSWSYSFWLGTISAVLFLITLVTGVALMFIYIPSIRQAYWSIEDIEFITHYGWLLRYSHRWAGHLMVVVVFLHMMRVFYTASYRETPGRDSHRYVNWVVGVILLLATLFLAFTGYLLPWDQLSMWAVTVATAIGRTTPVIGETLYRMLVGGTTIDQATLIRFYTFHCIAVPVVVILLISYHLWRIRKDGGLASTVHHDVPLDESISEAEDTSRVLAVPAVPRRIFLVTIATWVVVLVATLLFRAPLLEPATQAWTPNPAKAPWYFLWLQELISYTTIKIGHFVINGGFVGGVFVPAVLFIALAVWPSIDNSPNDSTGIWFHRTRLWQNVLFTVICLTIVFQILFSYYCRGPYWHVYWPWNRPEIPGRF